MTDIPNRRQQDLQLDEFLKAQTEALGKHVEDYHPFGREEVARMVKQQKMNTESIGALTGDMEKQSTDIAIIRTAMEGVPEHNANGVVIGHVGGMRNDIADLTHLANGGGGFAVKRRDKWHVALTVLGASLITASGFVVSAWIG